MNRRMFLAAALAPGLPGHAGPAGSEGDLRLGVCTYSLRNFPRAKAIDMVKQLNIGLVSIKEMHLPYKSRPEDWAAGRREFESAGLTIASGGVIYIQKNDDAGMRFCFDYAKACGMPMMVVGATHETLPKI